MVNAICFIGGLLAGFLVTAFGYSRITQEDVADAYADGFEDGFKEGLEAHNGDSKRPDV